MPDRTILDEQLDRVIARVEAGKDAVDHDAAIKPAWRKDPIVWARERLKLPIKRWTSYAPSAYRDHVWDGTREPLSAMADALVRGNGCAVFSGTGTGKTFMGAVILLWWLDCWEGAQVITVAPKKEQLEMHIWKEVGRLWPLFQRIHPKAEMMSLAIRMRPKGTRDEVQLDEHGIPVALAGWGAVGFVCGVAADEQIANKARGFHAKDMLFLCEETTGIDPAILMAIAATCTAPHNLRLFFGNPDSQFDGLSQAAKEPGVERVTASALDHPNVVANNANLIPGAQSRVKLAEWREKWGEDSPLYQSRARGIPPEQASNSLVRAEWIDAAVARGKDPAWVEENQGAGALGVDVANSEAGDKASIARGRGAVLLEVGSWPCPDANEFARHRVWPWVDEGWVPEERVGIDSVGVGAGTVNEMKRLGAWVTPLNGGLPAWRAHEADERHKNLRAQMQWMMRLDLQHGRVSLPDDPELRADLLAPTWRTMNGTIIVEPKEDIKKRLGRSPDKGDAAVYWNFIRQARPGIDFATGAGQSGPIAL